MKKLLVVLMSLMLLLSSCTSPKNNNTTGEKKEDTSASQQKAEPAPKNEPKVKVGINQGDMAPDFTLKNIDGKDVKLSDYKGKTVVLNFFGVWCPWCVREMPGFMNILKDYKDKNVDFLIVDVGDTRDKLVKYLNENKYDIKPVMDTEEKVSALYRVTGFPTSYIIDKEGIIQKVHRGYMEEGLLRTILGTVNK